MIVVPRTAAVFRSPEAAHGLLVPGQGATVTRRGAFASLVRGKMENSLIGGVPGGKPLISPANRPAHITFYVALPPPGRQHNVVRYPIAVVGPGYRGLLVSSSTRLAGLVSVADVAPSLRALDRGERPKIRARPSNYPLAQLARLDRRLNDAHDARVPAMSVLAALMALLGLLALFTRSSLIGRAAFLVAPASVAIAVLLSAVAVTTPWVAVLLLALTVVVATLGAAALLRPRVPLALGLGVLFAFLFAVMWARPEWNTLAVIGPHPDGGGRFYGLTNQVETLLLSPALVLGALAGLRALPVVALVVAAGVAASRIGADGGGLVVYLAGFLVLGLRVGRVPALRAAGATAVAAGAALLLVGIDAATGGSSHVTDAVGGGPGSLAGDLAHRVHLSAASVGSTWNNALLFGASIAVLAWLAVRRPRLPVLDALLAALVVSLVVNDTPTDVAGWGVLSALVLWAWVRSGEGAFELE
ncbi:MAG: hypothetical protein M3O73_00655 [Actinomycetota bacterium]|nr:hypothetical protein [Actinomycetota bacterium]